MVEISDRPRLDFLTEGKIKLEACSLRVKETKEELSNISVVVNQIEFDVLPSTLEVQTEQGRAYVSVRRIDGASRGRIVFVETPGRKEDRDDFYYSDVTIKSYVRGQLMDEGQIGVLVLPDCKLALPTGGEKFIQSLPEKYFSSREIDRSLSLGDYFILPSLVARGYPFAMKDWKFSILKISMVKRVGDDFLVYAKSRSIPLITESGEHMTAVLKMRPNREGQILLAKQAPFFLPRDERLVELQKKLNTRYGKFYVLAEGGATRSGRRRGLQRLVPAPAPVC